jgi:hypothetical protein
MTWNKRNTRLSEFLTQSLFNTKSADFQVYHRFVGLLSDIGVVYYIHVELYYLNSARTRKRQCGHLVLLQHIKLILTGCVTRLTRRATLEEQELLTLPEHLSSRPVFSGVRITRSLVLYVCFVDRCLSFCSFSFGHCVVCPSSIYGSWLPLWYLQTLLTRSGLALSI